MNWIFRDDSPHIQCRNESSSKCPAPEGVTSLGTAQGYSNDMYAALLVQVLDGFGDPGQLIQLSLHHAGIQPPAPARLWLLKVKGRLHLGAQTLKSETQSQQNLLLANLSFLASREGN